MSTVNKFGESSSNHHHLDEKKIMYFLDKMLEIDIDREEKSLNLHFKKISKLGSPIDPNDAVTYTYLNENINKLNTKIEEIKNNHYNALNVVNGRLNSLKTSMQKDAKEDIELIQKAINNSVLSANKEFINIIEERFETIENFMLKYLEKEKGDDVKAVKIKQPFIKF